MVIKGILDQQPDFEVELYRLPEATMFQVLSTGEIDIVISAWLPNTHYDSISQYATSIIKHSLLCDSLGLYLVVPQYTQMWSIDDLFENRNLLRNTIVIPESQNAIYEQAKNLLTDYGLNTFSLQESTWDHIVAYVDESTKNNSAFAFIGLRPHWIFRRYELRTLYDKRHALGEYEQAFIYAHNTFPEKLPVIARFLSNVRFTLDDMETLMEMNQALGTEPYENAIRWINNNTNRINRWLVN
jgi:glycine betaine/proline transport system substrate-binding protein